MDIKRVETTYAPVFSGKDVYKPLSSSSTTICEVYSHGGRHNLGLDALKWIKYCEDLGAGEILLTSMDRDGTKDGYDTTMLQNVKELVNIPVIASGGAGTIQHIKDALDIGDAALLASLLHYGELTIQDIKQHLSIQGITIR